MNGLGYQGWSQAMASQDSPRICVCGCHLQVVLCRAKAWVRRGSLGLGCGCLLQRVQRWNHFLVLNVSVIASQTVGHVGYKFNLLPWPLGYLDYRSTPWNFWSLQVLFPLILNAMNQFLFVKGPYSIRLPKPQICSSLSLELHFGTSSSVSFPV